MIGRKHDLRELSRLFRIFPIVGILGPRQIGKTTLALAWSKKARGPVTRFDLEDPADLARLEDASPVLRTLRGIVVIDEIQRRPELTPFLRVLADRKPRPARFLILGSASPHLLRQTSESLAGRIAYLDLLGLGLADVPVARWRTLWLRGGFPQSFLARTDEQSLEIRKRLIRSYLERDLPALELRTSATVLRRLWTMLAHYHGQVWNSSEFARSLGVSDKTARSYLDLLHDTFMVRVLPPWSANIGKRVVKSPKVYVQDTGLLHALLDLPKRTDLESHPKAGASFEGFAMQEVIRRLGAEREQCFFWATHQGAELDLLVTSGKRRYGFEFKFTDAPAITRSMRIAWEDLGLSSLDVIHAGKETYPLSDGIRAVALSRIVKDLDPL